MPSTTNLGIVTPSSNDFVTNGATAMTTMADDIDAYAGAPTTYTPTTTNVAVGTVSGRYTRIGKVGLVSIGFSAGTAAAAGTITASLPSGWTVISFGMMVPARNGNALCTAYCLASATTITIHADASGNNFASGASVASVRCTAWLYLT